MNKKCDTCNGKGYTKLSFQELNANIVCSNINRLLAEKFPNYKGGDLYDLKNSLLIDSKIYNHLQANTFDMHEFTISINWFLRLAELLGVGVADLFSLEKANIQTYEPPKEKPNPWQARFVGDGGKDVSNPKVDDWYQVAGSPPNLRGVAYFVGGEWYDNDRPADLRNFELFTIHFWRELPSDLPEIPKKEGKE